MCSTFFLDFIGKLKFVKNLQACNIFLIKYPEVLISLLPKLQKLQL